MSLNPPDEFSWANPTLRERISTDPASVLRDRGINPPNDLPLPILHEFIRIAHLLWVDGKTVPIDQFSIDPSDEGLLFGRGAWESTRTINGLPWLWNMHLERLIETAKHLHIQLDPKRLPDAQVVRNFVRSLTAEQDVVIRLNITAGAPGKTGAVWMSVAPQPKPSQPLKLLTRRLPTEKGDPYLTLKTFQYATRLRIGQEAAAHGYNSALMVDHEGNIQEASYANIFLRLTEGWATPIADGGFLPGTVRRHLINHSPLPITQKKISLNELKHVKEVFVTNSGVGIIPVVQIDQTAFPLGTETQQLMNWLSPASNAGVQYRFVERTKIQR